VRLCGAAARSTRRAPASGDTSVHLRVDRTV